MYYVPSEKGLKYLSYDGEGPKAAVPVLEGFREFDDPNPKTSGQLARVLGLSETDTEQGLDYLAREGFLITTKTPVPLRKSPRKSPRDLRRKLEIDEPIVFTDETSGEGFTASEYRRREQQRQARGEYERSSKGKVVRHKYNIGKGKTIRQEWQKTEKGKAAQARWRAKIHLSQTGLAKLNDGQWTQLHDLLAFVHLEHPTKDQLTENDFLTLYSNKYI